MHISRRTSASILAIYLFLASNTWRYSNTNDQLSAQLSRLARSHNVASLSNMMRGVARSHSVRLKSEYLVARYYAGPRSDKAAFLRDFPTDHEGIGDVYALTPFITGLHPTYAFDALAQFAIGGETVAIRKLLLIQSIADGGLGDFIADRLSVVARAHPSKTLDALSVMPPATIDRIVSNPLPWCDSARAISAVATRRDSIKMIQLKIRTSSLRC